MNFKTFKRIRKGIENPSLICLFLLDKRLSRVLSDKAQISLLYRFRIGRKPNLSNPITFNEKLQWLKLHDRNPQYTNLVDKYTVREHIRNTIGDKYLVPLLGVYDSVDEIDYAKLPNQFVLKPTHTSGNVIICRDKDALDIKVTNKTLKEWMKREYFWYQREWPYKNIKPRIICEELLVDDTQVDLMDYKILCFNGEPKCLFVCLDRRSPSGLKVDFYDLNWTPLPFERHYPRSGKFIEKPECFEELLELSKILSRGISFVRVDFYIVNKQIKFGELTFYPGSGLEEFTPEEYDKTLGNWLDLSKEK
ncbi:TupA-like ATPgrasp [Sphaerochaeta associata]|uniref:Teichuronopeptide biosynthesis TupA-like protein n=1 Tax=Sphaerochaeta associata TaxID=1129264 RepID=A0ABY4DHU3_9SPIR|nr:ATP-grasp fold amidoligase family protein [Sphaerochaeta associata]UOM51441.1 hypothetical protein MUG09_01470 [Sphaerochaeta associata]SMP65525.1 TupA-like ATPgrasp [Sphaerochaeta associata]